MSDAPAPAAEKPRNRNGFVVLSWVTLIGFALFVGGVTAVACGIKQIQGSREKR